MTCELSFTGDGVSFVLMCEPEEFTFGEIRQKIQEEIGKPIELRYMGGLIADDERPEDDLDVTVVTLDQAPTPTPTPTPTPAPAPTPALGPVWARVEKISKSGLFFVLTLKYTNLAKSGPAEVKVSLDSRVLTGDKLYFSLSDIVDGVLKFLCVEPSTSLDDIAKYFYPSGSWVFKLKKQETFETFSKRMCEFVEFKDEDGFLRWSEYDPIKDSHRGSNMQPRTAKQLLQLWKTKYIDRIPALYGLWGSDIVSTCFGTSRNLELFQYNPWALHTLSSSVIERIPMAHRIPFGREIHAILQRLNNENKYGIPLGAVPAEYHPYLNEFFIKVCDGYAISETQYIITKKLLSLGETHRNVIPVKYDDDHSLNAQQNAAVRHACENKFTLVTGGAGVGKTRTIKRIVEALQKDSSRKGWLVAVAGKAVQRIKEIVGESPGCYYSTIHSAVNNLSTVCTNPNFIIVDEVSMTSLEDLYDLLMKLPSESRMIMFGDHNQLSPIKGQNIFEFDYIDLEEVNRKNPKLEPIVLTQSYRSNSEISRICNLVLDDQEVTIDEVASTFHSDNVTHRDFLEYIEYLESGGIGYQIITPYIKEVDKLTAVLKSCREVDKFGFFKGEKILVNRNHFRMNSDGVKKIYLANGEIGKYIDLGVFVVSGKEYHVNDIQVTSGEVLTVHKVQGSEFNTVVYWNPRESRFVTKKLVYTAFSRAKERLIILGKTYRPLPPPIEGEQDDFDDFDYDDY